MGVAFDRRKVRRGAGGAELGEAFGHRVKKEADGLGQDPGLAIRVEQSKVRKHGRVNTGDR